MIYIESIPEAIFDYLVTFSKKLFKYTYDSSRRRGTQSTSGISKILTVREHFNVYRARPAPTLPDPAPSPPPCTCAFAISHACAQRTQHSMSTASTLAGMAGKVRNQSAHMRAACGCANARAGGQYMRVRGGYGSPAPITRLLGDVVVETGRRGRSR